jgi:monoamine oxidase
MNGTDSRRALAAVIDTGLAPRADPPRRVIVVGAGMAGLVAAGALLDAGHDVSIVEARARVGGRIRTIREPFTDGLYGEAGAARIPASHDLTLRCCRRFNLALRPITSGNPQAFVYLRGRRYRAAEIQRNPGLLPFDLASLERGRSIGELWASTLAEITAAVRARGDEAWSEIVHELDDLSTREFLESRGWSEGAIELFGLLAFQEGLLNAACVQLIREEVHLAYVNLLEIEGGMDRLPRAYLARLGPRIRFGARLVAFDQHEDGVRAYFHTEGGRIEEAGDFLILAVPAPALYHVEAMKPFAPAVQRAISGLVYLESTRILMQFRRRFWEDDDGIRGGGSVTDLPIRAVFYPDHHRETGRGVLIASATLGRGARQWAALSPALRTSRALEDLARLHPQAPGELEVSTSCAWHHDEYAGGAFALFDPGDQARVHEVLTRPEGRVYFAGEHAADTHAWIQGAIESGLRAAIQIHARQRAG